MSNLTLDGFTYEEKPVYSTEVFSVYRATADYKAYMVKVFKRASLVKYNLQEVLEYNVEVLWGLRTRPNWLCLKSISSYDAGNAYYYENYDETLEEYIRRSPIQEKQALDIVHNILSAIYDAFEEGYYPVNVRPEQLVRVGNTWKLSSLVFDQELHGNAKSPMIWDPSRQPPEAFAGKIPEESLCNTLAWDIGSILLNMLKGSHTLSSLERIRQLHSNGYNLDKINMAEQLKKVLRKILELDSKKRMSLLELYEHRLFFRKERNLMTFQQLISSSIGRSMAIEKSEIQIAAVKGLAQKSMRDNQKFTTTFIQKEEASKIELPGNSLGTTSAEMLHQLDQDLVIESKIVPGKGAVRFQVREEPELRQSLRESLRDTIMLNKYMMASVTATQDEWRSTSISSSRMLSEQEQENCLRPYKLESDKSSLFLHLTESLDSFAIPTDKESWKAVLDMLLKAESLRIVYDLASVLNRNENKFGLDPVLYADFRDTRIYSKMSVLCRQTVQSIRQMLQNARAKAKTLQLALFELTDGTKGLASENDLQKVLSSDYESIPKDSLRLLLKYFMNKCYQWNLAEHKTSRAPSLIRLNMWLVQLINIDKIYRLDFRAAFWGPYFDFKKQSPTKGFECIDIIKYIDYADEKHLLQHLITLVQHLH